MLNRQASAEVPQLSTRQDSAVVVDHVTKHYNLLHTGRSPTGGVLWSALGKALFGGIHKSPVNATQIGEEAATNVFTALQDISFSIKKGECLGILGRNGAGKSTLLEIVVGTLQPSSGQVSVKGRVGALLELGSGFNPKNTGRENIFLGGTVLGLTKIEIEERLDEILAFADIGEFVDQPMGTYSSGMSVRLAFAVNACIEPDLLVVDEALAVGDAPFQAKCYAYLNHLRERGTTILFTSHSIETVRALCDQALWLDHGRMQALGETTSVTREYERFCWRAQGTVLDNTNGAMEDADEGLGESGVQEAPHEVTAQNPARIEAGQINWPEGLGQNPDFPTAECAKTRTGSGRVEITDVNLTDEAGQPKREFLFGETIYMHVALKAKEYIDRDISLGVRFADLYGNAVVAHSDILSFHRLRTKPGGLFRACCLIRVVMPHGQFSVRLGVLGVDRMTPSRTYDFKEAEVYDGLEDCLFFSVSPDPSGTHAGPVFVHAPVVIEPMEEDAP